MAGRGRIPDRTALAQAALALVLALAPSCASGQQTRLDPGDRIRIVSQELPDGAATGSLVQLTRDSLQMIDDSVGTVEVSLVSLGQFEVSRGPNPFLILGAAASGALLGGLLGSTLSSEDVRCELGFDDVADCSPVTSDLVVGAAAGAIVLGLIGRAAASERWVQVRLDLLLEGLVTRSPTVRVVMTLSAARATRRRRSP